MKWKNIDQGSATLIGEYRKMTPYEVLRVDPSASTEKVRKAYRDMIRAYHPDLTDSFMRSFNEEIAKIINGAYEAILRERNEPR